MKKLIYVVIGVLAGCAIGYAAASFRSGPHLAYAQFAGSPIMCSNGGNIPIGYVVVNSADTNNCNGPDGSHGYVYTLQKLVPNGNGTTSAVICTGTPVPSGFVTTGWSQSNSSCKAPGSPANNLQSITTYN
jgi:hypothetical protein